MSFLDTVIGLIPTIKPPTKVPTIKQKLLWTLIVLVLFFLLGTVALIGLDPLKTVDLGWYQTVLASNIGTLLTLGIGPIVVASIILQLLAGIKLINFDFSDKNARARFSGLQTILAIVIAIIEAVVMAMFGLLQPLPGMFIPVVLQIVLGAVLIIYFDDIINKYGVGSGIGLFIAAGVSQSILWRLFSIPTTGNPGGLIFYGFNLLLSGSTIELLRFVLVPILMTLLVFFAVIYAESMHVNIPLTVGRSGMGAKYPVKFLYVSVMPVILASTLFVNISLLLRVLPATGFVNAVSTFLSTPNTLVETIFANGLSVLLLLQGLGYMLLFVGACVVFGKFWVEVGGQGVDSVAKQLQRSGMSIPGFRRDERVIVGVLNRYIPTIVILGSIFVGLLSFFSDLTGAIGTGTGVLLTVGVIYRFYEQLAKEQAFESSSMLKQLVGK
jgi:preprotein translocase subunit SecY